METTRSVGETGEILERFVEPKPDADRPSEAKQEVKVLKRRQKTNFKVYLGAEAVLQTTVLTGLIE